MMILFLVMINIERWALMKGKIMSTVLHTYRCKCSENNKMCVSSIIWWIGFSSGDMSAAEKGLEIIRLKLKSWSELHWIEIL